VAVITNTVEKILLAAPRGYCAGVDRAVQTVERALACYGAPVYVRKEIVHNKHVVEQLRARRDLRRERDRGARGLGDGVLRPRRCAERA
jgi:4-hydroxy-3-methylbut-2-enyl diphosphate reductase IspH